MGLSPVSRVSPELPAEFDMKVSLSLAGLELLCFSKFVRRVVWGVWSELVGVVCIIDIGRADSVVMEILLVVGVAWKRAEGREGRDMGRCD